MPDTSYDAIVIGGGTPRDNYCLLFTTRRFKTLVCERQHELGGGACGEELPLPGFIQNTCAHFTRVWTHPVYTDFHLREYGLKIFSRIRMKDGLSGWNLLCRLFSLEGH